MCPVLRGEALPLPAREINELRERLDRSYGDAVVPTPSGPYMVIRVPHREPDFLRDLEAAVDALPYRDIKGFRGVLLVGDRAHMGVSTDMLRALFEGRRAAERDWVALKRRAVDHWSFIVDRIPSDPERRLHALFRVDTESVEDLDDADFDRLAEILPAVKAASPGQTRPARAYLVSEGDHVILDGATFFTELERRRRTKNEAENRRRVAQLEAEKARVEEKHDLAVAHLERILQRRSEGVERAGPAAAAPPRTRSPDGMPPLQSRSATTAPPPLPTAAPSAPEVPEAFRCAARHDAEVGLIRDALVRAGYKLKERLLVGGRPIALAAARLDGYPTRVLVSFVERLDADEATGLLTTGRGVGAELVLVVAEATEPGVDRVTLATNLKVIEPSAVRDLRFG